MKRSGGGTKHGDRLDSIIEAELRTSLVLIGSIGPPTSVSADGSSPPSLSLFLRSTTASHMLRKFNNE